VFCPAQPTTVASRHKIWQNKSALKKKCKQEKLAEVRPPIFRFKKTAENRAKKILK
jgi:hypothetical protein